MNKQENFRMDEGDEHTKAKQQPHSNIIGTNHSNLIQYDFLQRN